MSENLKLKKACSFFVSDMHFITMMLPYINKKIENNIPIITILEKSQIKNIELILNKINLNEKIKNKIMEINWKKTNLTQIKNNLNLILNNSEEIEIIISGNKNYINKIKKILEKYFQEKNNKIIKIIHCYELTDFNNNIQEILDENDVVINTSGEHAKQELYEGYTKKVI